MLIKMCGHIFSRLARYRIMFTDVNLKELIGQIVSDYGVINIGDLKKHDDYDEVDLVFSLQENSGKLYFNNDRIHICINSNNEIIEYDINLCCDVLIRKYTNYGDFYASSEIYESGDIKIMFNANGGQVNVANKKVKYGETYGELPVPIREGYIFKGWIINDNIFNPQEFYDIGKDYGVNLSENDIILSNYAYQERYTNTPIQCKPNTQYIISYDWEVISSPSSKLSTGLTFRYDDDTCSHSYVSAIHNKSLGDKGQCVLRSLMCIHQRRDPEGTLPRAWGLC